MQEIAEIVAKRPEGGATPWNALGAGARPPIILVVEDHTELRQLIVLMLRRQGFVVREAANGSVARAGLSVSELPDLVLTDLNMAHGDGWALLRFCQERLPALPVVIASGEEPGGQPEVERWARDYFQKPFSFPALVARLRELCVPASRIQMGRRHRIAG